MSFQIESVDSFVKTVDQTLTRTDEKLKLQALQARIEMYDALDLLVYDTESSKVSSLHVAT